YFKFLGLKYPTKGWIDWRTSGRCLLASTDPFLFIDLMSLNFNDDSEMISDLLIFCDKIEDEDTNIILKLRSHLLSLGPIKLNKSEYLKFVIGTI
ncbi:hypothetical protein RXP22_28855, partial [Pseudomonas aeruginosa]|nr:hypothetical protein [Pseudomonas aeruginosa]